MQACSSFTALTLPDSGLATLPKPCRLQNHPISKHFQTKPNCEPQAGLPAVHAAATAALVQGGPGQEWSGSLENSAAGVDESFARRFSEGFQPLNLPVKVSAVKGWQLWGCRTRACDIFQARELTFTASRGTMPNQGCPSFDYYFHV